MARIDIGPWPHEAPDTIASKLFEAAKGKEIDAPVKSEPVGWIDVAIAFAAFVLIVIGCAFFSPGSLVL